MNKKMFATLMACLMLVAFLGASATVSSRGFIGKNDNGIFKVYVLHPIPSLTNHDVQDPTVSDAIVIAGTAK